MSVNFILWLLAIGSLVAFTTQWVVLRARYIKGLDEQRARHQQQQQATQQHLEVAKQQIARLQRDLSARLQVQRVTARQRAPQRPRIEPAAAPPALPVDGFADTLPTPQYPHDIRLPKH
jgi:hypothetical protein